jgi:hypothetical protein
LLPALTEKSVKRLVDAEGWTAVDMKSDWKSRIPVRRKMKWPMAMKGHGKEI